MMTDLLRVVGVNIVCVGCRSRDLEVEVATTSSAFCSSPLSPQSRSLVPAISCDHCDRLRLALARARVGMLVVEPG